MRAFAQFMPETRRATLNSGAAGGPVRYLYPHTSVNKVRISASSFMQQRIADVWLRLIGISLFSTLSIVGEDMGRQPLTAQTIALIGLQVAAVVLKWHLNRAVIAYCRPRLMSQTAAKRLGATLGVCILATTVLAWWIDLLRYFIAHRTLVGFSTHNQSITHISVGAYSFELNVYGIDFFHAILISLFFVTIYELLFYRQDSARYQQQLLRSEQEREKLRVANLQSQLDVLKSQVNPHFLFNALNSLSSLISEDPRQAELFVDKLSGVYRYVLRANRPEGAGHEQHLTTLAAELHFMDAYYHLLKTRFGDGLTLTVTVDQAHLAGLLPPLTLQLLVENAVKHNVVSPKRPLSITIGTDAQGWLVVQNNRQHKASRALSNGVGLSNIMAKYQMLSLPPPIVDATEQQFTVRLPLLPPA